MAQVDRSLRETIRRLHAMNAGGVSTRYSTRHVQISTNPFLMSFIRIAGLNRPLGVVYGRVQETQPTILLNLDPRNDDSFEKFSVKFGKSLLEYFGVNDFSTRPLVKPGLIRDEGIQAWVPDAANLNMLHNLNFALYKSHGEVKGSVSTELGRLLGFLFEHAQLEGQQLVVNASKLLSDSYVIPADDYISSQLASIVTWINSGKSVQESRAAAIDSLLRLSSTTLDASVENLIAAKLGENVSSDEFETQVYSEIHAILEPEFLLRWNYLVEAWSIANLDEREDNKAVKEFVMDSANAYIDFQALEIEGPSVSGYRFDRNPWTDDSPVQAALQFLDAENAAAKFEAKMVHDDIELLADALYKGEGFLGVVKEVIVGETTTWVVKLDAKYSQLLKRRESESYRLAGSETEAEAILDAFDEGVGDSEGWTLRLSWAGKSPEQTGTNYVVKAKHNSQEWVDQKVIFAPSYSATLHKNALQAVKSSIGGKGAWLFEETSDE